VTWRRIDEASENLKDVIEQMQPPRLAQSRLVHAVFKSDFLLVVFNNKSEPARWMLVDMPDWWL